MQFRRLFCVLILLGTALPLFAETVNTQYLKAPLVFEPNRGQSLSTVRFLSRGNGHTFLLLDTEAILMFADRNSSLTMKLLGQNPRPSVEGVDLQRSVTNYFHGNDPGKWIEGVPHFARVRYKDVYSGIDVVYYGSERQLEYDFEIQPKADPSKIAIEFHGAQHISVGPEGDLILSTPGGEIRHQRPIAFQRRGSVQVDVDARFVLRDGHVSFELGRYDRRLPLTIDPKLVWSSYLGGTGDDQANDVAVDSTGNVYITGFTSTVTPSEPPDPPPVPTLTPHEENGFDAFVTKLDSSGGVVFTTYYGGTAVEEAHSLALDSIGNIHVTGYTTSTNFPVVNGFQTNMAGVQDAYILRMSNSGVIQFSSYLGGSRTDRAFGVAIDSFDNAYVVGSTFGNVNNCTSNFPIVNAFQSKYGGGGPGCGLGDAFVTKVTPAGTLGFSTFLGGGGNDQAYDVALDSDNNIIVTGFTSSQNFPVVRALYGAFRGGVDDVFITKFNSSGTALEFSTYFGGSDTDNGVRLAVDANNKIYVTGYTRSLDFPLKNPPQIFHNGEYDAFLLKLHADGQDADFSTFIGGEDTEGGVSVAVDQNGFIYVAGFTNSLQFYAINAVGGFLRGLRDAFVLKMAPDASSLVYSTYLGGFSTEGATGIAVDSGGNAYVVGYTGSFDFPVADNAFQSKNAGSQDGFIVKINADDVKTTESYSFPIGGGVSTFTAGQTASPIFGYVAVDIASGSLPTGLEIIDLRSAGTLINEVSIPIPPVGLVGRLYLSTVAGATTAITMVNPNDQDTRVDFYFTPKGGETNTFGNFTLPAHAQTSGFLTGEPFNLRPDLVGTLTYTAELPVATTALLVSGGSAPTNVYLPIMNPYAANNTPVVVPQFVDGEGWSTQFFLINPTEDTITGEIRLFKADSGQPGVPAELVTEQGLNSVFGYSIEPRGLFTLTTRGESPAMTVGFAHIEPSSGSSAPHAYGTLVYSGNGFVATTVEAVPASNQFKSYVELTGNYPEALATNLGLALANSLDTPATVTLKLTGFDGTDSGLTSSVTLPPKGHLSAFLSEIPGFENLPDSPYAGVLHATTTQPGVTLAAFRARHNEQGTFLVTATGPLKDVSFSPGVPPPNPMIIPHLVDGGGFATQIIVINGTSGGAASGSIRYLNPSGDPLNLAITPPQ